MEQHSLFSYRPISARLFICPDNPRWKMLKSARDLFLHEFMHALGFGLIIPKGDMPMIKERTFIWRYIKDAQIVTTHYMDFQSDALRFARAHFGCDELEGIEAEDEKKIHLSEYIYGNELMTPVLANGRNFFTRISASILESTMLGSISWYKANSSYVDAETAAYWYGYKWGCEFVRESCFSYIAAMNRHRRAIAFPFCEQQNLLNTIQSILQRQLHPSYDVCFSNGTSEKRLSVRCNLLTKIRLMKSSIGLTALPLTIQLGEPQFSWIRFYGSEDINRYCPFVQEVVHDWMPDLPENAVVVDCSMVKVKSENYLPTEIVGNNYFAVPKSIF
uniref:Leishmanolysin-like peptidase n=1 Tax=Parascaris univalens TaxID=6257 RepID=A0A915ARS2_PARUN